MVTERQAIGKRKNPNLHLPVFTKADAELHYVIAIMASIFAIFKRKDDYGSVPVNYDTADVELGLVDAFDGNNGRRLVPIPESILVELPWIVHLILAIISSVMVITANTAACQFHARWALGFSMFLNFNLWSENTNFLHELFSFDNKHRRSGSRNRNVLNFSRSSNFLATCAVIILLVSSYHRRSGMRDRGELHQMKVVDALEESAPLELSKNPFGVEASMARSAGRSMSVGQRSQFQESGSSLPDSNIQSGDDDLSSTRHIPIRKSYLDAVPDAPRRSMEEIASEIEKVGQLIGRMKAESVTGGELWSALNGAESGSESSYPPSEKSPNQGSGTDSTVFHPSNESGSGESNTGRQKVRDPMDEAGRRSDRASHKTKQGKKELPVKSKLAKHAEKKPLGDSAERARSAKKMNQHRGDSKSHLKAQVETFQGR